MAGKHGKITLKDLSAVTGVSATAISHILNDRLGHVRASESTQRRVLSAARELGYVPRLQARSMATRRSYAIGVVCFVAPGPQDPYTASYFANALGGVEEVCKSANHHCIYVASNSNEPAGFVEPRLMKDGSVDGVVLVGIPSKRVAVRLLGMGLPCIQVGSNIDPAIGIHSVSGDIDAGVEDACRRLAAHGHRRVQFALPVGPGSARHLRVFGALGTRIDRFDPMPVTTPRLAMASGDGRELARAALALPPADAPTAFICPASAATGLVAEMRAAGRSFPTDYSLIVLASEEVDATYLGGEGLAVATISIPTHEVARQAALTLFQRLHVDGLGLPEPSGEPRIPCPFHDGESYGPCPTS